MHQAHGPFCKFIPGRLQGQFIEHSVGFQELVHIGQPGRFLKLLMQLHKGKPLLVCAALCRHSADQALYFPARLEQFQLLANIDLGYKQAALRQNDNQVLARQSLHRFPYRRATYFGQLAQLLFRNRTARLQDQHGNGLLKLLIGDIGQFDFGLKRNGFRNKVLIIL